MALTTIREVQRKLAQGNGFYCPFFTEDTPGAGGYNSSQYEGRLTVRMQAFKGSSYPSTLNGIPRIGGTSSRWLTGSAAATTVSSCAYLGFYYKIGTLVTTATGNQFTHDAATFPVLRTFFGETNKPVPLIPFFQVTTAITVTDPRFRLQTAAGAAGYVNQDGTSVIGTVTNGWSGVTKGSGFGTTAYLNDWDCAVQDITQIRIDTASTAGAVTVWGFEPLMALGSDSSQVLSHRDGVFAGMQMMSMMPALATSGTAVSFLGSMIMNYPDGAHTSGMLWGIKD